MRTKDIEFLSVICSFTAWITFVIFSDIQDLHYSIPAIVTLGVCQFLSQEKGGAVTFVPNEYSLLTIGYVTLPLVLLICCSVFYSNISDAYWAFIAFSCSLGASLGAYVHLVVRNKT